MKQKMKLSNTFQHQLNVRCCYFNDSILTLCEDCQTANKQSQYHFILVTTTLSHSPIIYLQFIHLDSISTKSHHLFMPTFLNKQNLNSSIVYFLISVMSQQIFNLIEDHLSNLTEIAHQDNQAFLRKITFSNQLIVQLQEMVNSILSRSKQSFQRLSELVHNFCQTVHGKEYQELINESNKTLHNEQYEWGLLENDLNMRKILFRNKKNKNDKLLKSKISRKMKEYDRNAFEQQVKSIRNIKKNTLNSQVDSGQHFQNTGNQFQYRMRLRQEFIRIKQFVVNDLSPMLEYAENKQIPKKIILNIYIRWNHERGLECTIRQTGKIQMQLTNQLKTQFPKIAMTRRAFKGIHFRQNFINQLELTDRSPPICENDITFDQQQYLKPIEKMLREDEQNLEEQFAQKQEEIGIL